MLFACDLNVQAGDGVGKLSVDDFVARLDIRAIYQNSGLGIDQGFTQALDLYRFEPFVFNEVEAVGAIQRLRRER